VIEGPDKKKGRDLFGEIIPMILGFIFAVWALALLVQNCN
jgi:hypothetical protein